MVLEDYPLVTTMGVAWQPPHGPLWQLQPLDTDGWVEMETEAIPVFSLGPPIIVNVGNLFPAGWWLLAVGVPVSDTVANATVQLIEADGTTTTVPTAGTAYSIVWTWTTVYKSVRLLPPTSLEDYLPVTTMGVGWQLPGGPGWQAQPTDPDGWTELGGIDPTFYLGAPITVSVGTVLAAGWWVIATGVPIDSTTASATAQLVQSDGTTPSPAAGSAYPAGLLQPPINTTAPTITGTGVFGTLHTAGTGTWTQSPTSYAFQWQRNGVNIAGATSSTYTPVAGDVGANLTVQVTATNAVASTSASSAPLPITTTPPVIVTPPVISGNSGGPGVGAVGDVLTTTTGTWTNSPTSYQYQWLRNNVAIPGANLQNYTTVAADHGYVISNWTRGVNDAGLGSTANSSNTIAMGPPIQNTPGVISGSTVVGGVVSVANNGVWTSFSAFTYQWQRNGVNIAGATATTHTLVTADVGTMISCIPATTNAAGSGSGTTNAIGPIVGVPVLITAPVVTGNSGGPGVGAVGDVLTTTTGTWTNNPTSYIYQWLRNLGAIAGNAASRTVIAGDNGAMVSCATYGVNAAGNSAAGFSNDIFIGPPFLSGAAPIISGSTVVGGNIQLTNNGGWSVGTAPGSTIARVWQRNGAAIADGPTGTVYTTVAADVGALITCAVTFANPGGTSAPAVSNAIGPITATGTEEDPDFVAPMPSRPVHRAKPKKKR
jgi:uncharacterized membrane protein